MPPRGSARIDVSVPRLVGSANAGTMPGALTFELCVKAPGAETYYLQRKYRELTGLQAELVKEGLPAPRAGRH